MLGVTGTGVQQERAQDDDGAEGQEEGEAHLHANHQAGRRLLRLRHELLRHAPVAHAHRPQRQTCR